MIHLAVAHQAYDSNGRLIEVIKAFSASGLWMPLREYQVLDMGIQKQEDGTAKFVSVIQDPDYENTEKGHMNMIECDEKENEFRLRLDY